MEIGDIVFYGLILEFVGRFSVCVSLFVLGEKEFVDILMKFCDVVGK